jgi:membrane-bound serine protease (ClpP class)
MTALGVSLLVIGAIVVTVEAHVPTLGVLGGPGVIALAAGSVLAVSGLGGGLALGLVSALLIAGGALGMLVLSLRKGASAHKRRVRSGPEGMIGQVGVVRSWDEPTGKVLVDGALWRARRSMTDDDEPGELQVGDAIVVERLSGLTLAVRPAEEWELASW